MKNVKVTHPSFIFSISSIGMISIFWKKCNNQFKIYIKMNKSDFESYAIFFIEITF